MTQQKSGLRTGTGLGRVPLRSALRVPAETSTNRSLFHLPPKGFGYRRWQLLMLLVVASLASACAGNRNTTVEALPPVYENQSAASGEATSNEVPLQEIEATVPEVADVWRPVSYDESGELLPLPKTDGPLEQVNSALPLSSAPASPLVNPADPLILDVDGNWPTDAEEIVPERSLSLPEVLMMLRQSPRMAALRANIGIMQADRVQAQLLPNPEFNYERFVTLTGDPDAANDPNMYTIAQPLLLFGQRDASIRTADLEISATQAEVFAEYADLVVEIRRLHATMLIRQSTIQLLEESLGHFEHVERIVEGRAEAGDVSLYDLDRVRVEVATFRTLLVSKQAELTEAAGELSRILGVPHWIPLAEGEPAALGVEFNFNELAGTMQQIHPRILAARNREAAARSRIELARRERLPVPTLEMGWFDATIPFAGALYTGISIPTNVFDRGQGTIGRAEAETRQATLERQAATMETQAELRSALLLLQRLRKTLEIYEQQIRERLPQLRQMAEEGYQAGEIRIVELLDATNIYVEPQLNYLDLLEAVMHAEIEVLSATGMVEAYIEPW